MAKPKQGKKGRRLWGGGGERGVLYVEDGGAGPYEPSSSEKLKRHGILHAGPEEE